MRRALLALVVVPAVLIPATTAAGQEDEQTECHPAYDPCLPIVDDLNCDDIGFAVRVIDVNNDPYRLDADNDGIGCDVFGTPPTVEPEPDPEPAPPVEVAPAFTG